MKASSIFKKLGHFRTHQDEKGIYYFTSRAQDKHFIKVWKKENGNCTALPIRITTEGEEIVAFHPRTIKSLLDFMERGKNET